MTSPTGIGIDTLLADFVTDPIFRRSFCERPAPWGQELDCHGPFLCATFSPEWFVPIASTCLATDIAASIRESDLYPPPTEEQRKPIDDSITSSRPFDVWKLMTPDDDLLRVDWSHVWYAFQEYVTYDRDISQIAVAVIVYD